MSLHSTKNSKHNNDDIQFKIVSRSSNHPKAGTTMSASGSDYEPMGTHLPYAGHQKLSQVIMNDTTDIFNDGIEGGGVEPSINESIRQSIQCSFVSSECGEIRQQYKQQENQQNDNQRSLFVMNRMNWINHLKVLFDQLESYNQRNLKHVETQNFIKGLRQIKNILPMMSRNEYYKNSSEVAFTYKEVEAGVSSMPSYVTWDNLIDIFLTKSFATQQSTQNSYQPVQQIGKSEVYQHPDAIDDSKMSEYYEEVDIDQSYQDRYSDNRGGKNRNQKQIINKNSIGQAPVQSHPVEIQNQPKRKRDEDFFLSFADSLINHGNMRSQDYSGHQIIAQAPLIGNPNIGLKDKDDDEACEIDSDFSGEEESKNNSRRQRSKLEESIRSSRTATFKSVRRTSTHNQSNAFQQSSHFGQPGSLPNALSQATNVQDSYYQMIKNSTMPHNYQQQINNQQTIYYQQSIHSKNDSRLSQQNQMFDHNEDCQVEVASNRSYGSQKQMKAQDNNGSLRGNKIYKNEDIVSGNQEKSTRISSLNSVTKNINAIHNNTILSQESSQSSQNHYRTNNSKIDSSGQNSTSMISASNYADLEIQGKNLKNIDIDYKSGTTDKRQLRSLNFSSNLLMKLPMGLEKTLQFMNVSFNKLKSLNGIEQCVNLKFLNVSGNQLTSASNLAHLQSMRELIFSHNQLSLLKEIGQLKNLQLLDVSFNKIIEFDKVDSLMNLKKLATLSLAGNLMSKIGNYETVVLRKLPQVKSLDPDCIKDYSQFSSSFDKFDTICFTDPPENLEAQEFVIVEQISHQNIQKLVNNPKQQQIYEERPRSRTPNRDRPRSQLGKQPIDSKLKSTVISPQRNIIIGEQSTPKASSKAQQFTRPSTAAYNNNQFRLQTKLPTSNTSQSILPNKMTQIAKSSHRASQLQPSSSATRDRSYTGELPKPQVMIEEIKTNLNNRDRSTSNISSSRNIKQKQFFTQALNSGRNTAQQSVNSSNAQLQHQITNQSAKETSNTRKLGMPSNLVKTYSSQGKITPRRNNMQTPRQDKQQNVYKKSFCTEEDSIIQKSSEKNLHGTPSEKNTVRTAQTQDSSNKKHQQQQVRSIQRQDPITIQSAGIMSPAGKQVKAPTLLAPKQNAGRPITNIKQRVTPQDAQQMMKQQQQQQNMTYNTGSMIQSRIIGIPQSTKNSEHHGQSFVFESAQVQGRITPNGSQNPSNRPSSQLQKFITNSGRSTQQQFSQNSARQSLQPSQASSVMSQHAQPSQKITNLIPKCYNQKGNPGDKKSKADMSLSMISNGNNANNTSSQAHDPHGPLSSSSQMNSSSSRSHIKHTSILQTTNGNLGFDEDDSPIESPTSRSISPVLEESSNMDKLKVGFTQFMNKQ